MRRSAALASGANKFVETGRFWYFLRLQKVRIKKFFRRKPLEKISKHKFLLKRKNYFHFVQLLNLWLLENLFAFDLLIANTDRRKDKLNLLFLGEWDNFWLIDHEKAFANTNANNWQEQLSTLAKNHTLQPILKKSNIGASIFDTFAYYLENINWTKLNQKLNQLHQQLSDYDNIPSNKFGDIIAYLHDKIANPNIFISFLKDQI